MPDSSDMERFYRLLSRVAISALLRALVVDAGGGDMGVAPRPIPRRIYTFWDGPPQPPVVIATLATWARQNPDFEVISLSRANAADFLPDKGAELVFGPVGAGLTLMQLSDLIRLEVIAAHGGVWLDCTAALTVPLDFWVPSTPTSELIGFDLDFALSEAKQVDLSVGDWASRFSDGVLQPGVTPDPADRYVESWAFAAAPGCVAMRRWRDAFRSLALHPRGLEAAVLESVATEEASAFVRPAFRKWLPYLAIHFSLAQARHTYAGDSQMLVRALPAESYALAHLEFMPSPAFLGLPPLPTDYRVDIFGGPVFALARSDAVGNRPGPPKVGPVMKLRRFERCALDAVVTYRSYAAESPLAIIFSLPNPPSPWIRYYIAEPLAAFQAMKCDTSDPFLVLLFRTATILFGAFYCAVDAPLFAVSACVMSVGALVAVMRLVCRRGFALGGGIKMQ